MIELFYALLFAGILLILVALVLTVVWNIPSVIDEISGRKAKRQISRMRSIRQSTRDLEDVVTGDFYLSMSNGGTYADTHSSGSFEGLGAMVDNPYDAVLEKTGVAPNMKNNTGENKRVVKDRDSSIEENATGILEEAPKDLRKPVNAVVGNIIFIKELSSLK